MEAPFGIIHTGFWQVVSFLASFVMCPAAAAQSSQVQIHLAESAPEVVWRYKHPGAPCTSDDYADVPVRPFLVNGAAAGTYRVLWFAANSNGYFGSETAGPDMAPADVTLQHFKRRPNCPRWVRSKPYPAGSLLHRSVDGCAIYHRRNQYLRADPQ